METKLYIKKALAKFDERLQRIEEVCGAERAFKRNWLDQHEVSMMLNISKRTIASYREANLIPFTKIGGKIYYPYTGIENLLVSNLSPKKCKP